MSKKLRILEREIPLAGPGNAVVASGAALVVVVCAVVFAVGLVAGAPLVVYGTALGVGLLTLAFVLRRVFAALYPQVEATELRKIGGEAPGPLSDIAPVRRRQLLVGWLGGAGALLAAAFLAPIASLGPRRAPVQAETAWAAGTRLVTPAGVPIRPEEVPVGGMSTVWPDNGGRHDTDAVILVRLSAVAPQAPTNLDWVIDGHLLAYSKICTHLGCPVGLFQERQGTLFCPCHQQSFDATRAAVPTFGPAARRLPQLPLGVDDDGYLVALGDFVDPVGPPVG